MPSTKFWVPGYLRPNISTKKGREKALEETSEEGRAGRVRSSVSFSNKFRESLEQKDPEDSINASKENRRKISSFQALPRVQTDKPQIHGNPNPGDLQDLAWLPQSTDIKPPNQVSAPPSENLKRPTYFQFSSNHKPKPNDLGADLRNKIVGSLSPSPRENSILKKQSVQNPLKRLSIPKKNSVRFAV